MYQQDRLARLLFEIEPQPDATEDEARLIACLNVLADENDLSLVEVLALWRDNGLALAAKR